MKHSKQINPYQLILSTVVLLLLTTFGCSQRQPPLLFKCTALTNEISQDLDHALKVMKGFGMDHAELRQVWDVNVEKWDPEFTQRVKKVLDKHHFKVVSLASPLFKCTLPPEGEDSLMWKEEKLKLENLIRIGKTLHVKNIRIFGFKTVSNIEKDYPRIVAYIKKAVHIAQKEDFNLIFENVGETNFCTTEETIPLFESIDSPSFGWIWDPGNDLRCGGYPYPDAYNRMPKERIYHVHLKDVQIRSDGSRVWTAIGDGALDIDGICRSLYKDGYQGFLSLETHFIPEGGTREQGTRASWRGLKSILLQLGKETSPE